MHLNSHPTIEHPGGHLNNISIDQDQDIIPRHLNKLISIQIKMTNHSCSHWSIRKSYLCCGAISLS